MKPSVACLLALIVAAPASLSAASKAEKANAALVSALQAVSPDPLGGKMGLDLANRTLVAKAQSNRVPSATQPSTTRTVSTSAVEASAPSTLAKSTPSS